MDLACIEGPFLYFDETDISINISLPDESQVSPFRHNVTSSTPARKTSAVEGDLVSGLAQVNEVKNQTKTDDYGNISLATITTKELVTKQCSQCLYSSIYSGNMPNCILWYHIHKICAGKNYLKRHVLNKHEDKKILCDQCSFECGIPMPATTRLWFDNTKPNGIFGRYCQKNS